MPPPPHGTPFPDSTCCIVITSVLLSYQALGFKEGGGGYLSISWTQMHPHTVYIFQCYTPSQGRHKREEVIKSAGGGGKEGFREVSG